MRFVVLCVLISMLGAGIEASGLTNDVGTNSDLESNSSGEVKGHEEADQGEEGADQGQARKLTSKCESSAQYSQCKAFCRTRSPPCRGAYCSPGRCKCRRCSKSTSNIGA